MPPNNDITHVKIMTNAKKMHFVALLRQ